MRRYILLNIFVVIAALLPVPTITAEPRCFPQVPGVTACIDERFRTFWQQQGGLATFGYPLAPAHEERTAEGTLWVQYFERQRLEWHPENPRPYQVLLGRLGDELLQRSGRNWHTFPTEPDDPTAYPSSDVNCQRFDKTGFSVCEPFIGAWRAQGVAFDGRPGFSQLESLALWGLPLSPAQWETNTSGDRVVAQWFERARFEWHPENRGTPYEVLKGRLGARLLIEQQRPAGTLVRGHQLSLYRGGQVRPWVIRGINYNPAWGPWALWDRWDSVLVAADLDRIAAIGANTVRVPLPWRNFRRSAPRSAAARSAFRHLVQLAAERELRLVPILFDEFCKYGKPDGARCWDDWAWNEETVELAAALPAQYRDNSTIAMWEITNEPAWVAPDQWTWQGRHRENRLAWLRAAADAIRRHAPYQPVFVGVSFPHEARDVIAAGASEVISLHYYPEIHHNRAELAQELASLSNIHLPILIGEIGASSSAQYGGSETRQVRFLCKALETIVQYRAGVLWWHLQSWSDQAWESQLGIYRVDGTPKPAAYVFSGRSACPHDRSGPL